MATVPDQGTPWYRGVTAYQWLVLAVASAGWVFDVYEGQIFNITRDQLLREILHVPSDAPSPPDVRFYGDVFLGVFLAGGALGGVLFGMLADRWGRRPTMIVTIVCYSVFSVLTYFTTDLWQVGVLRFLVAVGVGGEWAVAAALVAEVFPPRSRAYAGSIFHGTSVLGTWLAALAGYAVGSQWRYAYLLGLLPVLLTVGVRAGLQEPESWAATTAAARGSLVELLTDPRWRGRAVLGLLLATVGLGTFWGVTVAGQDLARAALLRDGASPEAAAEPAKLAYGIVQSAGGGLGLLAYGPLAQRLGRRGAFVVYHVAALLIVPVTCYLPATYYQLLCLLPVFGFATLGLHAGYAVYFPELFPTHLRATGSGFCFNGGRLLSVVVLVLSGWLKSLPGMDLRLAVCLLSLLFLVGLLILAFLPETKGQPLPA